MNLPADLLDQSPEEAVRRIALGMLDEAQAASERLADEADDRALHDFRVALRRLRSTLSSWRRELKGSVAKRHLKALRKLQNATGGGRDAQVALEWLETQRPTIDSRHRRGFDGLVDGLDRRQRASMVDVRDRVMREFDSVGRKLRERCEVMDVRVHLGSAEPTGATFGQVLAERLRAQANEVVRRIERVHGAGEHAACHRARIATKRLRYLAAPASPFVDEGTGVIELCKELQDTLGDLNDSHVLQAELAHRLEQAADEETGLLELSRRVRKRTRKLYRAFEKSWLVPRAESLTGAVETLATALEAGAGTDVEIERKYLLRAMPDLPEGARMVEIEQGWLPGERLRERLRRTRRGETVAYFRTIKLGRGLQRVELEEETTQRVFDHLWTLTEGCRIHKRRYEVPDGDLMWEIDEFLGRELVLAEVELPNPERIPALPSWLASHVVGEVTDDVRYTNLALAQETLPEAGS